MNAEDREYMAAALLDLKPLKFKLSAKEAIGFGQFMLQLNQMGLLAGALNDAGKKFFNAGREVEQRSVPDTVMTIGEAMDAAEANGDEGTEIELNPSEVVALGQFLRRSFGGTAVFTDELFGGILKRIDALREETTKAANEMVAAGPTQAAAKA